MSDAMVCQECGEVFTPKESALRTARMRGIGAVRYCSRRCSGVACQRKRVEMGRAIKETATCVVCQTTFQRNTAVGQPAAYCSPHCRNVKTYLARNGKWQQQPSRDGTLPIERDEAPVEWDGKTMYSTPLPRLYRLVCMCCANAWELQLTDSDTKVLPRLRCARCRGRVTLEEDYGMREPAPKIMLDGWNGDMLAGPTTRGNNQFAPINWWQQPA